MAKDKQMFDNYDVVPLRIINEVKRRHNVVKNDTPKVFWYDESGNAVTKDPYETTNAK